MALFATPSLRSLRSCRSSSFHLPFTRPNTVVLGLLLTGSVFGYSQDAKPAAVHIPAATHVIRKADTSADSSKLRAPFSQRVSPRPNLKSVATGSGIVFTCDSSVDSATCDYLNTTVAGWYNSTFTNANASIYIQYGATGLAQSTTGFYNFVTYDQYVTALTNNATKSTIQTSALTALSTYDATPYGNDSVEVTGALGTTLGFSMVGTTAGGNECSLPGTGCYNGIITVTNDPGTPLYYDNLSGTEPSDAYDFYGVVAHETDEVLGTSSCISTQGPSGLADDCDGAAPSGGPGTPSAVDLFRYSSAGELVLDSSLSLTPGAYFSYDGGSTNGVKSAAGGAKLYNTLYNGDDYADFISSSPDCGTDIVVQDAEGCPGEDAGLSILNDGGGEIHILNAVGYDVPSTTPAPAVKLSQTSIAFGNQLAATSSPSQAITLTNSGTATLTIASIELTGTDPTEFGSTNNCGATLTAGSFCTINADFAPTATGPLSAAITITDNASDSPQSISLTGTGTTTAPNPPKATLTQDVLSFGSEKVGKSTGSKVVTLKNNGGSVLDITSITLEGTNTSSFVSSNTCGSTLAVGAKCTFTSYFKPTKKGKLTANVSIIDNASHSPQKIWLKGSGD